MITTDLYDKPPETAEPKDGKKVQTVKAMPKKAPEQRTVEPAYNYGGCFAGGYFGGTAAGNVDATDPVSSGGAIPAGTFYNAPFATAGNGGAFEAPFRMSPTAGGTLGCNWQRMGSPIVYGVEGEAGFMRLHATAADPYSEPFNNDTFSSLTVGDWYGALTGRIGWAFDRALFYAKGGAGFSSVKASFLDTCSAAPCGTGLLTATTGTSARAFWVAGMGVEFAWTGNWTVKMEYLFLGLNDRISVCGPGGGTSAGSTFCGSQALHGIHTTKLGLNYKFF
jgi:outer membrane immunogenic protein